MNTEWISVKDKMPHIGTTVIVYPYYGAFQPDHVGSMVVYRGGNDKPKFEFYHDQITHWQPMPKAPK